MSLSVIQDWAALCALNKLVIRPGHTYLAYGPLLCGAQTVVYEGVPVHPTPARCWQIVEKYKASLGLTQLHSFACNILFLS